MSSSSRTFSLWLFNMSLYLSRFLSNLFIIIDTGEAKEKTKKIHYINKIILKHHKNDSQIRLF